MSDKLVERQIRELVREMLIQEGFFGDLWTDIKTGAKTAYDAVTDMFDVDDDKDAVRKSSGEAFSQSSDAEQPVSDLVPRAQKIASAYPKMASYANDIVSVSDGLGIDPDWLANVINFESRGGDPAARNPTSNATGIIQFMPRTAENLGTSVDELREMSGSEQMKFVEKYFKPFSGKLNSQEDVYMAVFYPVAIGDSNYRFPEKVVRWNPGIYTPSDYAAKANSRAKLA